MFGAARLLRTCAISFVAPAFRAQLGLCALARNVILTLLQPGIGLFGFLLSFATQCLPPLTRLKSHATHVSVLAQHRIAEDRARERAHGRSARSRASLAVGRAPVRFPGSRSTAASSGSRTSLRLLSTAVPGTFGRSSLLLGVDDRGRRVGAPCFLLEPDRFRGRCEPVPLAALFGAQRGRLLRFALTLGRGLLLMCLGLRRALRFLAVSLDLFLALLGRDFVLEALALELGLGLLCLQLRFGISLPCFGLTALRVGFSVDLRLLQATLRARSPFPVTEPAISFALPAILPARPPAVRSEFS